MKITIKAITISTLLLSQATIAGTITGGTYLDNTGANKLETWLGVGDQDFTNVWSGGVGVSTSSFHNAVDGVGATFSIYEMTIHDGLTAYIGGFTNLSWGAYSESGYLFDADAFIFNLTTDEVQRQVESDSLTYGAHSIYANGAHFATFGAGHDLTGASPSGLGLGGAFYDGYTYSYTYELSLGQISVAGDSGSGSGDSGINYKHPQITGLQVYTFESASAVPVPAAAWLFSSGLLGLIGVVRRKKL